MSPLARLIPVVVAVLFVSACDTIPVRSDRGQETESTAEQESNVRLIPLEEAEPASDLDAREQARDPEEVIEEDLREAASSQPPYRQNAYLDAARKLIDARRLGDADAVLGEVITTGLAQSVATRKSLLQGEIHYHRDELDRALRFIDRGLRTGNTDPAYISRGLDIKGRIELRQGRPLDAARAWIRRDNYLADRSALAENHERIWFALGRLNELELQVAGQSGGAELQGWLDLAILFLELGGDPHGLRTAVSQWAGANDYHPAASFAQRLLGPDRSPGVRQVALLLPLSSNYGSAAQMVYNGFDAAHHTDTDPGRPQVVFYDVGGEPALAGNYVGVAAADGADVIVGPLGKSAVNALLENRQPERPMVLLGSASGNPAPGNVGLYQFDLAPEPEARLVAEYMFASGHRRVAALYPQDEWGQRVYAAFTEHWRTLGGTVAEAQGYAPDSNDFTAPITNLFNITESENRKSYLQSRVGLNLHFDARRRRDIDALFMATRPDEARLLKPQIDFFQGHDLPVYSTSHVYTGTPDAVKDTDLDGITFPEMPWLLRNNVRAKRLKNHLEREGFSNVSSRLFAFGFDAYHLALLAADPAPPEGTSIRGMTSELVFSADGRILRRLDWARFKEGVPVRIWND